MEKSSQDIVSAARTVLSRNGALPLSFDEVAQEAGVSRALIYAQFGDQFGLLNALISDYFSRLEASSGEGANGGGLDAFRHIFGAYYDLVAAEGPAVPFILRDAFMKSKLDGTSFRHLLRFAKPLSRALSRDLKLDVKEAFSLFLILLPIAEEPGRMAYAGVIDRSEGRALSERLLSRSLEALACR